MTNTKTIKIKPTPCDRTDAAGKPLARRVRMPGGGVLPAGGQSVTLNTFWKRRLASSEVVEIKTGAQPKKG